MAREGIADGVVGTYRQTVEAYDAAAHIGDMVIEIYTLGLAYVGTLATLYAEIRIYVDMEGGALTHESERSGQGAQRIAEQAPAPIGHDGKKSEDCGTNRRRQVNSSGRQGPDNRGIESERLEPGARKPGRQQKKHYEEQKHGVTQGLERTFIAENLTRRAHSTRKVDQRPEGTHRRAVYPPEHQGHSEP